MFCIFLPLMGILLRKSVSHFPMGKPPTVETHKWTIQSIELKQDTQGHWKVLNSVWEDGGRGGYETNMNTCVYKWHRERRKSKDQGHIQVTTKFEILQHQTCQMMETEHRMYTQLSKKCLVSLFFLFFFFKGSGGGILSFYFVCVLVNVLKLVPCSSELRKLRSLSVY